MKRLMESWSIYLKEAEKMNRVSKAVMIDDDGRVLILKRAADLIDDESPWEWDLPGGHIKKGESDKEGLEREVEEETSLKPLMVPKDWYFLGKSTRFYLLRDWDGEISLNKEHQEYKWIDPGEVKEYFLGDLYTNAIRRAYEPW
jgi:8-oxo-dGTP diphosphatase